MIIFSNIDICVLSKINQKTNGKTKYIYNIYLIVFADHSTDHSPLYRYDDVIGVFK